jgi:poly(A) polymerase
VSRDFAIHVVRELRQAGFTAYWAGGCVRDLLRGEEPNDYDIATDALPRQVRTLFGPRRTLAVGESFGVVIVLGSKSTGEQIEVATFRTEAGYSDGRRPDRVVFAGAEEDARRRDFTINGMFYDPLTETVHDFVGGHADLQQRLVRAIGDPCERMREDKLRLMRGVRFAAVLEFDLDPGTARAISEMASQVIIVSAERIAQELRKMLSHSQRARAMQLCEELNLLDVILPEVREFTIAIAEERWSRTLRLLREMGTCSFETAGAALLRDVPCPPPTMGASSSHHGTIWGICRRLKLSNEETGRIAWLVQHRHAIEDLSTKPISATKRLVVHPQFQDLLKLERLAARIEKRDEHPYQHLESFLSSTPAGEINPPPLLSGGDLLNAGYRSGPDFKVWLTAVRDAQLNGQITTREEALEMVRRLQEDHLREDNPRSSDFNRPC